MSVKNHSDTKIEISMRQDTQGIPDQCAACLEDRSNCNHTSLAESTYK